MIHNLGNQFYKFRPVIGELPDQGVSNLKVISLTFNFETEISIRIEFELWVFESRYEFDI